MPRLKPKAQRLAPPTLQPHPIQNSRVLCPNTNEIDLSNPAAIRKSRPTSVRPQSKTAQIEDNSESGDRFQEPYRRPNTKKRKRSPSHTKSLPAYPEEGPTADCSHPNFSPSHPGLNAGFTHVPADLPEPRQAPQSCSSSDTASVGLADHIIDLEAVESKAQSVHRKKPICTTDRNRSKQTSKRIANDRVPRNSVKRRDSRSQRLSDDSKARQSVVTDPTSSIQPLTLRNVSPSFGKETPGNSSRQKYVFLRDEEVNSRFNDETGNFASKKARLSQRQIDKDKLRDYWEEIETVSIRKSNQSGMISGKSQRKTIEQAANRAPSLSPDNVEISLRKTSHKTARALLSQRKVDDKLTKANLDDGIHPITEENLDGGDPIPLDQDRRRKLVRRVWPSMTTIGRSSGRETRKPAFEKNKRTKESEKNRENNSTRQSRDEVVVESGEASRAVHEAPGNVDNVTRSSMGRNDKCKEGVETTSSTGLSESEGQACMQCGGHGKASKMVLCDTCSDGCHTFCMRPSRTSVPLGVWICPKCHLVAKKHEVHLSQLGDFLERHGLQCVGGCKT